MPAVSGLAAALEKLTAEKPWKQYLLAALAVGLASLLRELLFALFGINLFAVLFLPAVMIAGLACGLGAGVAAAILGTFAPLLHITGTSAAFFPASSTNMAANILVIGLVNLFLAYVAASHRALRKRAEMLAREFGHRTKNLLSIVVSIAHRTARGAADVESYQRALETRLLAMAETYDFLVRNQWNDTSLHSAVATAIAPFAGGGQIAVQGPDLAISPAAVENIMMAAGSAAESAASPPRRGFGTSVLTEIVPRNLQGNAKYTIGAERVLWELDIPLRGFVSPAEPGPAAPGRVQPA
jgi:HWE histidine kinase